MNNLDKSFSLRVSSCHYDQSSNIALQIGYKKAAVDRLAYLIGLEVIREALRKADDGSDQYDLQKLVALESINLIKRRHYHEISGQEK